ncbi:hypothetical protein ACWGKW_06895 [Streptomyces sp. NPDC054766]|uniref:hypothetical protein n=1 Tax=Streptomyces rhizosphaerihabitans TaxID=1266770 RepID=UPI0021C0E525|nr:hypothetical protein [Streptomyces rhizosphaerihabitans]MCT9003645.1 hypothetical protein [Streptomyces rhizosphaerihabitans]
MSESAEAESSVESDDAPPVPRARRRGRTTLLIATAAVLGLVAGTCTGFLVQADREPTKLPPLSQPVVAQAKGEGPEPLSAAQDHRVKTDGDLRKLLLPRPKGTKVPDWAPEQDGWLDLAGYAHSLDHSDREFEDLIKAEFRRGAGVSWTVGSTYSTEIRLVQYRQEENLSAAVQASDWNVEGASDSSFPGASDGMVYLFKPERKAGYLPLYKAQATASRGDIAMEIWIFDSKPIPKSKIMDLAKRQLERL